MEIAEFDQFSDEYYAMHKQNISITGESPEYFAEYKIKLLGKLISKTGRNTKSILDFGSGPSAPISCWNTPKLWDGLKGLEQVGDAPQTAREPRRHAA